MRKLLSILLVLLMVTSAFAGVNVNGSANLIGGSGSVAIQGHFPMTMGGWVFANSLNADGDGLISNGAWAGGVGRGWLLHISDTFNCGSAVVTFVKGGGTDHFICSAQVIPTGSWQFIAAVVTSTKVHFFIMTAAGVVTTQDVADNNAFTANTDVTGIGGSTHVTSSVFLFHGAIANAFVFGLDALSDDELKGLARSSPMLSSHPTTLFVPLYFYNAAKNMPDLAHGVYNMGVISGTGLNFNQCPCGMPTGEGH